MINSTCSILTPGRVQVVIGVTFLIGTITLIAFSIAALIGAIILLKNLLTICIQVVLLISQLYSTGGPFVQLCLLLVALILFCKVSPYITLVVRHAVKQLL